MQEAWIGLKPTEGAIATSKKFVQETTKHVYVSGWCDDDSRGRVPCQYLWCTPLQMSTEASKA
jgi:hypothetical protein